MKTSLRKEIMSDFSKILPENQKEMLKLIAPDSKTRNSHPDIEDFDSETENTLPTVTSTPLKPNDYAQKHSNSQ